MADALDNNNPYKWKQRTIVSAIAAALTPAWASDTHAQDEKAAENFQLEEVIVSARKRDENVQDIPQSIQAFGAQEITKIGIKGLTDIAKFVPAMTVVGSSAGFNKIVFRGLADSARPYIADSSAAIYLDEQPLTTGAQSPEIRPIDMERIEALAGPQGTLYGASSQSGTLRYIVAKPDTAEFDANVGGGLHSIDSGGTGWDSDAMVNIPLIKDKLAIRLVGFAAKDAGFIDNVFGYTPGRIDADTGELVPGTKTNADIVKNNINSSDWLGARASIKWQVNDDWALTGIYNYNDSTVNGYNDYDPTIGDLKTVKFHKESWDDNWSNFQFTVDGDLGFAQLTSSTSYFERDTAYVIDATNNVAYYHSVLGYYGRGSCGSNAYYAAYNVYDFATACELNGTGYDTDDGDPTGFFRNDQRDTRWTHETRLTGSTSRWDWTLGFFYQEAKQHWAYGTHVEDLMLTDQWAAFETIYGALEPTDVRWGSDERSKRKDISVFGETTVNLTEQWKLLLGARWYDVNIDRTYTRATPATAPPIVVTPSGKDSGVLPKIGFQYFFEDNRMVYALYSEGFRAGGINRARGNPTLPVEYNSDMLKNYEMGLKSRWFGGSLQLNLIGYHQVWKDMQLELIDPSYYLGEVWQTVIANVGDAEINGVDLELTYMASDQWKLGVVGTYLFKSEIKDDIAVFDDRSPDDVVLFVPGGTQLPLASDINLAAYAEYNWQFDAMGGWDSYLRLQTSYTGDSYNQLVDGDGDPDGTGFGGRIKQPSYNLWDLRAGFSQNNWEITLYLDNFTDERAVTYHDTKVDLFWGRDNTRIVRPRTMGANLRYYFK